MPKYKVSLTIREEYELYVDAENEEAAQEIAREADIDEYEPMGYVTLSEEITEVQPVTSEDNING